MASYTEIDKGRCAEPSLGSLLDLLGHDDTAESQAAEDEATTSRGLLDDDTCLHAPVFAGSIITGIASQLEPSLANMFEPSFSNESRGAVSTSPRRATTHGTPLVAPPLAHQDVLAPGGYVGKYQLVGRLGQGAFGFVFTAVDTELDREVALKILNPAHLTNADVLQRFLQEARTTARIAHPGIVTILDFGQVTTQSGETTAFIAMELLQGESLTDRLARHGRLEARDAIEIVRQMASALEAAHRAQVLHRDLKPDNVYLVADPAVPCGERVKVFDFGLAKLGRVGHTQVESIFGTPRYMSPEQWQSATQIDPRSDIYSLGCILFELVTGETPFAGKLRELFEQHTSQLAPRASEVVRDLPPALDELIASMLAKNPAHRPASMDALSHALQQLGARASAPVFQPLPFGAYLLAPPPPPPALLPDGTHTRTPTYSEEPAGDARWAWKPSLIAFVVAFVTVGGLHWM